MAAAKKSTRGSFVIAAAIVLVGLMVVVTLVILSRDDREPSVAPTTPAARVSDTPKVKPVPTELNSDGHGSTRDVFSPIPEPSTSPEPSQSPEPSSSPSPSINEDDLVRARVTRDADKDRPGELAHVGNVEIYTTSKQTCASKLGASANTRYDTKPKLGTWFLCKDGERWIVVSGPVYGE